MMINLFGRDQICIHKPTKIKISTSNTDLALTRTPENVRQLFGFKKSKTNYSFN